MSCSMDVLSKMWRDYFNSPEYRAWKEMRNQKVRPSRLDALYDEAFAQAVDGKKH